MEQKEFLEILKKYRLGKASMEEKKLIDAWYEAMGQKADLATSFKEEELEKGYLRYINEHTRNSRHQSSESQGGSKIRFIRYSIGIAASVLIAIVSFVYLYDKNSGSIKAIVQADDEAQLPVAWEHLINSTNVAQRFTLPDGSSVTLEPNSSIKFFSFFKASAREVFLEGEGFFEVTHNRQKPFLVYANEVTTKVLGTSFTVRAFQQDANVTVAVKTGRVSVSANPGSKADKNEEIILTPNQKVIYDRNEKIVARRIVEAPQPIVPEEEMKRMRFEDAPLTEIFTAIEKIYGVDIEFDEALFASCALTTSVSGGGLYNRLDIITSAIGAKYELDENRIVIKGAGCN